MNLLLILLPIVAGSFAHEAPQSDVPCGPTSICDALCDGIACGWADDCFCAFCDGGNVCINGRCTPAPLRADPGEPNNVPARAHDLGPTVYGEVPSVFEGTIATGQDRDWFTFPVAKGRDSHRVVEVTLTEMPQDRDLDLAFCYRCDRGEVLAPEGFESDEIVELDAPIRGARCFASMHPWGHDERIVLSPRCRRGGRTGEAGRAWLVVWPASAHDAGGTYRLAVMMVDAP